MTTFIAMIGKSFYTITTLFRRRTRQGAFGPTNIFALLTHSLQQRLNFFLYFVAAISIELGVFNTMPIPMLDGGQALTYTLEAFAGRAISPSILHFGYLLALIGWMVYLNHKIGQEKGLS